MSSEDTLYTARFFGPELIERGRDNLIQCPVYVDGALAAPSSGTVSVFNASNEAKVNAAAVTVTGSIAQYTITAATIASLPLEDGWRVEWSLVMPDGVTHVFRRMAALVRRALYPVITDTDLTDLHSDLTTLRPAGLSSYQSYISTAWRDLMDMLREQGNFVYLIMEPSSFRRVHIYHTLEIICRDFSTSYGEGSKWDSLAQPYGEKFLNAWGNLQFRYDVDRSGEADSRRRPAAAALWLGVGPQYGSDPATSTPWVYRWRR